MYSTDPEANMTTEMIPENLEYIISAETEPVVVKTHRLSSIMPIIIFSYIGVLIRLGLNFLGNAHVPINAAFWPNFVGCMIMGFIVEQKIHIHNQYIYSFILIFFLNQFDYLAFHNYISV